MTKRPLRFLRPLAVAVALIGIASVTPLGHAYADTASSAEGLELSPAVVNLNADPGKSYTIDVKVTNVTQSTLAFSTTIDDFGAKDETGTPSIILDSDGLGPTSIKNWVESLPDFTLTPQQKQDVSVMVDVPANAEPGGHYGVIRFSGIPAGESASEVGQIASAGTLVLVRVSGDVHEALQLTTFSAATTSEKEGSFFETGPLKFIERFTNTGDVHVQPVGQIEIRDSFGNHVATIPVNSTAGNVLPGSVRRFEQDFTKVWLFGHYTANISIAYGTQGEAIVQTMSFWVIPYKLLLIALLILITLIYVFTRLIKRYNSYIIKRAKRTDEKNKPKAKKKTKS